jgi:hypothetical protein
VLSGPSRPVLAGRFMPCGAGVVDVVRGRAGYPFVGHILARHHDDRRVEWCPTISRDQLYA